MSRVYVLVEGDTELAFVRDLLTPALSAKGLYPQPILLGSGGIRRFARVERDVSALLKQDTGAFVSTLFDRYGLPVDWPGLEESKHATSLLEAHHTLCEGMRKRLTEIMGPSFYADRFVPHIQFYETEAFLFVDPDETARVLGNPARAEELRDVKQKHADCEHINDGTTTAPSKRIATLFPHYKKGKSINAHIPQVCAGVGLEVLRRACPLFDDWINRLEAIAFGAPSSNAT